MEEGRKGGREGGGKGGRQLEREGGIEGSRLKGRVESKRDYPEWRVLS